MIDLDINPADWYDTRELKWIPNHFTCVPIAVSWDFSNSIREWVISNTQGRYAFGNLQSESDTASPDLTQLGNLIGSLAVNNLVGFENPTDATMFMLQYQAKNNEPLF